MKSLLTVLGLAVTIAFSAPAAEPKLADCPPPPPGFPRFKMQEIASDLKIGYAVHICDVNGDGKPDIVVVDQHRVVWYENPTWKMHTILTGKTKPDNVCICSVTFEGKICFVLGAGWKPFDTKTPGTLQWLQRGKTLDDEWEMFPIPCDEPTVHRVAEGGMIKTNRVQFTVVPLMGRASKKERSYLDGDPVRVIGYEVPDDPTNSNSWRPVLINNEYHVIHNFKVRYMGSGDVKTDITLAAHEGIQNLDDRSRNIQLPIKGKGLIDIENKSLNHPASEIAATGFNLSWTTDYATVEPWHGNTVVYYASNKEKQHVRTVIDAQLRWGHAIKLVDMIPDEKMIIAGVRDNPDPKLGDTFTEKCGVRLYRATDANGEKWERYILEDGGVAVEDLAVADLNGDGKPDIIAVGRKTGNCRIYWNQGK